MCIYSDVALISGCNTNQQMKFTSVYENSHQTPMEKQSETHGIQYIPAIRQ